MSRRNRHRRRHMWLEGPHGHTNPQKTVEFHPYEMETKRIRKLKRKAFNLVNEWIRTGELKGITHELRP